MKHTLQIHLSSCEGAVVRALGLIERRGYSLYSCSVSEADGSGRTMQVSVTSSRPGDLLKRQLERLHDIHQVKLLPAVAVTTNRPGIHPINSGLSD